MKWIQHRPDGICVLIIKSSVNLGNNKVDYTMDVKLDDVHHKLIASQTIQYQPFGSCNSGYQKSIFG